MVIVRVLIPIGSTIVDECKGIESTLKAEVEAKVKLNVEWSVLTTKFLLVSLLQLIEMTEK